MKVSESTISPEGLKNNPLYMRLLSEVQILNLCVFHLRGEGVPVVCKYAAISRALFGGVEDPRRRFHEDLLSFDHRLPEPFSVNLEKLYERLKQDNKTV